MRYRIIAILSVSTAILLFALWSINNYINEKIFNEDKAALYDECICASYRFLSNIQDCLLVIIDTYEEAAYQAHDINSLDIEENFENCFFNILDNSVKARNAWKTLDNNGLFRMSAVSNYLEDGGKLREKESMAYRKYLAVWYELTSFHRSVFSDFEKYEDIRDRLALLKHILIESLPNMKSSNLYLSDDYYAWQKIEPINKLYIWKKHNDRKNWPFTFLNNKK